MLQNYLKIALRNLLRFKGYALLNILGLVLGISTCLLIAKYVQDELKYDQHHINGENIYRVDSEFFINDTRNKSGQTPSPLAKAMQADFPEVLESTRIYKVIDVEKFLVSYKGNSFFEEKIAFADSNFFEVLTYHFIQGEKTTALDQPFSVVLSDKMAKKIFGPQNCIGETLQISSNYGEEQYQVTGVFDSQKYRSHLSNDFYIASNSGQIGDRFYDLQEWGSMNIYGTYIKLQERTEPDTFTAAIPDWAATYLGNRLKDLGADRQQYLTNIKDIYLRSEGDNWHGKKGSIQFIYLLLSIGVFILFIACINFINLSTAKAGLRTKEVGVRKVIGASRGMLIKQFMSEAFVHVLIAVIVSVGIAKMLLPIFNRIADKELSLHFWGDTNWLLSLIGFIVITTLIAGSYPALYLSSFSPSKIFSNNFSRHLSTKKIRNGLVIFQFIIAIALIQGVLVIQQQMNFIRTTELGFNESAKVLITLNTDAAYKNYPAFRNELLRLPQISEVGASSSYPGGYNDGTFFYTKKGQNTNEGFLCLNHSTTPEFMQLMGFELLAGRFFDPNRLTDTNTTAVITERAMKGIGFTLEDVLDQQITLQWAFDSLQNPKFKVIGVIKDYHATSLHEEIRGQVFDWSPAWNSRYVMAAVDTDNLPDLLASMEKTWQQFNPQEPFDFQFLEDRLQQNYLAEQRMSEMVQWGTLLAIFICGLGLLGLVAFAAERREKEIGIRKILGASIANIVTLLSKDFIKLVIIALILTVPISWYFLQKWLDSFAYHIDISWWVFVLSGLFALGISLLIIGVQGVKAAVANPMDSLRNE